MEVKENGKICLFMVPLLTHGGGAEKYFINLARELSKIGQKVDIVTLDESFANVLTYLVSAYYIRSIKKTKIAGKRESEEKINQYIYPAHWIKAPFKKLGQILEQYTLIYTKNEILDLLILKISRSKTKKIIGFHTPFFYPYTATWQDKLHNILYLSFFYKYLISGSKLLHLVNRPDFKLITEKFSGFQKILIPYPFEVTNSNYKPKIEYKNTALNSKIKISFIGRIEYQKGVDLLIKLITKLENDKDIDFEFKIAGSGDYNWTKKFINLSKQYSNVIYLGHIPNNQIAQIYEWTDVVIIPSRYETTNYVALEAGAHQKIAVATNIPGPSDVILSEITGFLVDFEVDAFYEKIKYLYEQKMKNPHLLNKMGNSAYKHILEKFNKVKIIKQMQEKVFSI